MCTHGIGASTPSTPLYMDAVSVNGRDGAIRCSICINIYLAPLRRALREMGARLPSSPMCLPVPRSRYAGFPREDVPLVLRTGLPSESPPRPPPPRVFFALLRARSPYPLPSWSRVESSYLEPGCSARSIGRHNKKSKRQEILYARSTARGELHSNGCAAVPRFPPTPLGFPIRPSLASPPEPWMFLAEEISRRTRDSVR